MKPSKTGPGPLKRTLGGRFSIICSVVPDLVAQVTTGEASYLVGPGTPAIEEPAGGEVVELAIHLELQVRRDYLVWIIPQIAEARARIASAVAPPGSVCFDKVGAPFSLSFLK